MGLINEKMARPDEQDDISPESVRSEMRLPKELQNAYERVVVAGMKVLFSKETNKFILKGLESNDPLGKVIGESIAELIVFLYMQSNKSMPAQIIIPAGTELVVQAADFIKKSGLGKVTNQEVGDAIQTMVSLVLKAFGADPEKVMQRIGQFDSSKIPGLDQMKQQQGA